MGRNSNNGMRSCRPASRFDRMPGSMGVIGSLIFQKAHKNSSFSRFPVVLLNGGQLRVYLTRPPCGGRMAAICAFETWSDVSCRRKADGETTVLDAADTADTVVASGTPANARYSTSAKRLCPHSDRESCDPSHKKTCCRNRAAPAGAARWSQSRVSSRRDLLENWKATSSAILPKQELQVKFSRRIPSSVSKTPAHPDFHSRRARPALGARLCDSERRPGAIRGSVASSTAQKRVGAPKKEDVPIIERQYAALAAVKSSIADIKPGTFIGTATRPNPTPRCARSKSWSSPRSSRNHKGIIPGTSDPTA